MPAQTRGFLFSDLRGYSAYTERHGDRAARELLTRYRRCVRDAIGRFGGAEVRTEGDSFYVVFDSVSQAVEAGLGIQSALAAVEGEAIQAGIGIHAGEVEDDAEQGIVSSAVNIAARICGVAEPGEVLASETVRSLTRSYLDVGFVHRGRRKLKGIAEPMPVYRVVGADSGPAGMRMRQQRLVWGWPIAISLAAVGGIIVFAIAVMGGTLLRAGNAAQPSPSDRETEPSIGATGVARPTASNDGGDPFPNQSEQELLDRLPSSITAEGCVRADRDEIPTVPKFHTDGLEPLAVAAAVRCPQPNLDVFFFAEPPCDQRSSCRSETEAVIFSYQARRGVARGECSPGVEALARWEFGRAEGWVLCGPNMLWSYDRSNLLGQAIGRDAAVVYEWWHENARFPGE